MLTTTVPYLRRRDGGDRNCGRQPQHDSAADANRDGQITSYDALLILRAAGGA
ncbi:MAG: dockerin type I domain-containing protein [Candidatus Methanogasteraceae archaeon]